MKFRFPLLLLLFLSASLFGLNCAVLSSARDWPGSYCNTRNCCYPKSGKPPADFSVRGFWGYYIDGTFPSHCDSATHFDPSTLRRKMERNWATLACPSSTDFVIWKQQWMKHGTCSGLAPTKYFETAMKLKQRANLLGVLHNAGVTPGGTDYYSREAIREAITRAIGYAPALQCNLDKTGSPQLYEVYICVDSSASRFADCPGMPKQTCGERIKIPLF
ncbi:hypothetical protein H6P81_011290 [Aristolochia fimbriata]|uniref:Uncharacterized protein n=1 Tax=Aristolochia fimbriata TaxID=158543 RepID=A0AAV7ER26_ARIFI|nr:hypothetical protein H6P81_011290 [Aristolochia fimbriata]